MAFGKALLMGLYGEDADVVSDCGCGVFAVSEDSESIASAAAALQGIDAAKIAEMAGMGRRYYREKLSLKVGVSSFALIFKKLGSGGGSRSQ